MENRRADEHRLAIVSKWARLTDATEHARDVAGDELEGDLPDVLCALADDRCRELLAALRRPASANELCDRCDVPRSTVYRKLELLSDAGLVREYTEIRDDGPDTTLYERGFEAITIGIGEEDEFTLSIDRVDDDPEARIATFWKEMKHES